MESIYNPKLTYIVSRVDTFIARFASSPLYDFETETPERKAARIALDDCMALYAEGGVEIPGVEALARSYVNLCRRPERVVAGTETPPAPPPGTFPGKTQAGYRREMSGPPKTERRPEFDKAPVPEGNPQPLDYVWRIGKVLIDYKPIPPTYFRSKAFDAGTVCYCKLDENSFKMYVGEKPEGQQKPELVTARVYIPSQGYSYWLKITDVIAYQVSPKQEPISAAWVRGFESVK